MTLELTKQFDDEENHSRMTDFYKLMLDCQPCNERNVFIKWFVSYRSDRTYLKKVFRLSVEKLLTQTYLLALFLEAVADQWGFE